VSGWVARVLGVAMLLLLTVGPPAAAQPDTQRVDELGLSVQVGYDGRTMAGSW